MKILFTIPSMYGGGAERVMKYLVENIKTDEKVLCTLENGQKYKINKKIMYKKLTNIDGRSSLLTKIVFFIIQYLKFVYFVYKEKPDMIVSFLERSNIITILTPIKAKKVISIRSFISKKLEDTGVKGIIVKFFYKKLLSRAKNIVVPTIELKEDLVKNFNINTNNIKVIYNPIDLDIINNLKLKKLEGSYEEIFSKNKILINVGNLTHPKGQWHLIKIFFELKKYHNDLKLVILGEGPYHDILIKFSNYFNLRTYSYLTSKEINNKFDIYLLGFQKNPYKFLYSSDIFVFSSLREGFPNALIEAMSCNLPIISSNCPSGPKEIIENGKFGILLPMFSGDLKKMPLDNIEKKWVQCIHNLINDEVRINDLKEKSLRRVVDFSLHKIIDIWNLCLRSELK